MTCKQCFQNLDLSAISFPEVSSENFLFPQKATSLSYEMDLFDSFFTSWPLKDSLEFQNKLLSWFIRNKDLRVIKNQRILDLLAVDASKTKIVARLAALFGKEAITVAKELLNEKNGEYVSFHILRFLLPPPELLDLLIRNLDTKSMPERNSSAIDDCIFFLFNENKENSAFIQQGVQKYFQQLAQNSQDELVRAIDLAYSAGYCSPEVLKNYLTPDLMLAFFKKKKYALFFYFLAKLNDDDYQVCENFLLAEVKSQNLSSLNEQLMTTLSLIQMLRKKDLKLFDAGNFIDRRRRLIELLFININERCLIPPERLWEIFPKPLLVWLLSGEEEDLLLTTKADNFFKMVQSFTASTFEENKNSIADLLKISNTLIAPKVQNDENFRVGFALKATEGLFKQGNIQKGKSFFKRTVLKEIKIIQKETPDKAYLLAPRKRQLQMLQYFNCNLDVPELKQIIKEEYQALQQKELNIYRQNFCQEYLLGLAYKTRDFELVKQIVADNLTTVPKTTIPLNLGILIPPKDAPLEYFDFYFEKLNGLQPKLKSEFLYDWYLKIKHKMIPQYSPEQKKKILDFLWKRSSPRQLSYTEWLAATFSLGQDPRNDRLASKIIHQEKPDQFYVEIAVDYLSANKQKRLL